MNRKCMLLLAGGLMSYSLYAQDYLLSTPNTSLLVTAKVGEESKFRYYGSRISETEISNVYDSGKAFNVPTYPVFGLNTPGERALAVEHYDGNMTLNLLVEAVKEYDTEEAHIIEIQMRDKVYPFGLKQFFKAYNETDVISTWVEIENKGKKAITLYRFASAFLPLQRGENWITHFHGHWGAEHTMEEEKLTNGQKVISNKDGLVNTETDHPSLMITIDGNPQENQGRVFGGTLAWSGTYLIKADMRNTSLNLSAGVNEETSHYTLEGGNTFQTPEFAMSFSTEGKGGISRAFHRWARLYKLNQGNELRDILLNSWEGVYFDVNQQSMDEMMHIFSEMGGELFVMDDGWFGNKYPRNAGNSSLGDWEVCKEKLPQGIEGLLSSAKKYGIKFGIWIEPEMSNTQSELFEKHPDWIMRAEGRPLSTGRGKTQVVLDLTNPEVQDFVFGVVDKLMTRYPEIAYMKWDDNCCLMDYGSSYLPKNRQSHLYIDYHRGLHKVLQRIRAKYPHLILQACAGGGGRVNYGLLPYFNEFWTSDNTDALQRIYMQWGVSHFYPAIAMAAHVSADKNHQTGRRLPLKFRFDVAMSGRLGMEIQPKDMNESDRAYASRCIAVYKSIRPIVQLGDLYRLISPYENKGVASLMYTTPKKNKAVFFAYKLNHFVNMSIPNVYLTGLDEKKSYRITDLTPQEKNKPCALHGKVFSGAFLKKEGISLKELLKTEYSSVTLGLEEVE